MRVQVNHRIILIHIIVWICLSTFPLLTAYMDLGEIPSEMYVKQLMRPVLFYTNYMLLVPLLLLKRKVLLYILISIIFLIIYNYISEYLIQNIMGDYFPIRDIQMPEPPNMPPKRMLNMRYAVPAVFSLVIFLLGGIFALVVDFYKRERASQLLEHEKTDIKLQFLRNQLNPHFLFNSLNSIYSLVRSKSDDAPEAVITLSELMRYMLYETDENEVALEKELNYIRNYIDLQRLRLKNSEDVKINIHGDTKGLYIYPLILISFIENAFKYGTDFKGHTHIDIKINIMGNQLSFYVKNIVGIHKQDKQNSGVGLENIKNQLHYLYEDKHDLSIVEDKTHYEVNLTLNLNSK